jgi:hypothetical protein
MIKITLASPIYGSFYSEFPLGLKFLTERLPVATVGSQGRRRRHRRTYHAARQHKCRSRLSKQLPQKRCPNIDANFDDGTHHRCRIYRTWNQPAGASNCDRIQYRDDSAAVTAARAWTVTFCSAPIAAQYRATATNMIVPGINPRPSARENAADPQVPFAYLAQALRSLSGAKNRNRGSIR